MRDCLVILLILLVFPCSVLPLAAQSPTATVNGQVRDTSGAVVQNADIQLINDRTNARYPAKTNREGIYSVTNLPPGSYHMQVSKAGFKTIIKPDIVLNVLDARAINFDLPVGAVSQTVTVEGGAPLIDTQTATVSTVVDRQFAENLPMNGRSFQTLIQLTPGVVLTTSSGLGSDGQFSVNGQRANSNYWMVDGVSANIGMSSSPGAPDTLSGSLGGFSAQGGTSGLVSIDAMQEFRIQTSTFAPEFGRTPGGQISIVTRSGTNQLHGTVFDYFRNDVLDANDWFSDNKGLRKPEERQNDFGGTLSGPILKNRTFFFFSYEGLRLRLPQAGISTVPDNASVPGGLSARENAIAAVQPFFNAYPLPNGPEILANGNPTGTASFNASYSNRSTLNASSLRVDHRLHDKLTLFGRYNYAPSDLVARPGVTVGDALSVLNTIHVNTQTATAGATWIASPTLTNDFRANYSRVDSSQRTSLDNFGGAVPFPPSAVTLPNPSQPAEVFYYLSIPLNGPLLDTGGGARNLLRQLNFVDSVSLQRSKHSLKFGVDYRSLTPSVGSAPYVQASFFFSLAGAQSGQLDQAQVLSTSRVPLILQNLGLYGQDTWKVGPRLTITSGLRWDVDFTPKTSSGPDLPTVVNFNDLSTLTFAPAGTPVFGTRYGDIQPRIGIAYQLGQRGGWVSVLRGGWGIFYDLATSQFFANGSAYPYGSTKFVFGCPPTCPAHTFPLDSMDAMPAPVTPANATLFAYDPKLKSPYTQQWNVAFEQSLGTAQSLSATYVGAIGRHLLLSESFSSLNPNIGFATLVGNYGSSDYHALQLQFQRRLSRGLQTLASYSWAHSIDTGSTGAGGLTSGDVYSRQLGAHANRGPSDFDVRHQASVALTYDIPSPRGNAIARAALQHWSIENIVQARSASPVDVSNSLFYSFAGANIAIRPDVVLRQPFYLYGAQCASAFQALGQVAQGGSCPGGKGINPAAFVARIDPNTGLPIPGDLGRNALRGFGAWQWDFATHRDFPIGERLKLQFRAELFNVLNHPNFGPPSGALALPSSFGLSQQTLAQSLDFGNQGSGSFSPLYQLGGPRSVQFALKLSF
jgi:hypothetical protein